MEPRLPFLWFVTDRKNLQEKQERAPLSHTVESRPVSHTVHQKASWHPASSTAWPESLMDNTFTLLLTFSKRSAWTRQPGWCKMPPPSLSAAVEAWRVDRTSKREEGQRSLSPSNSQPLPPSFQIQNTPFPSQCIGTRAPQWPEPATVWAFSIYHLIRLDPDR